jgi:hypothetical protein
VSKYGIMDCGMVLMEDNIKKKKIIDKINNINKLFDDYEFMDYEDVQKKAFGFLKIKEEYIRAMFSHSGIEDVVKCVDDIYIDVSMTKTEICVPISLYTDVDMSLILSKVMQMFVVKHRGYVGTYPKDDMVCIELKTPLNI